MNIILFDTQRTKLLPFAYTRPIADFRCGILTLKEKWEKRVSSAKVSFLTVPYLQVKYQVVYNSLNLYVNGALLVDEQMIAAFQQLKDGEALYDDADNLMALCSTEKLELENLENAVQEKLNYVDAFSKIENVWDIFVLNAQEIEKDFELLTRGRTSAPIDSSNTLLGDRIFLEEGAVVQAAILNSKTGPIYVGKDAEIMEGSVIRGPFAMGEHAALKISAKIYGATTLGPHVKVGGEVSNSVIFGYSNKGHEGFLGNSVLGEWCNLGADTNVSNLKNNYALIKLWSYEKGGFKNSGQQFCGMMMGDHSKSGINTMFNTATVVGVSSNIYGGGFPRSFIPSFSWGGAEKWMTYRFEKAMEVAEKMMERRGVKLEESDRSILKQVFELSSTYRNF